MTPNPEPRNRDAVAVPGADVEALAEDLREPLRGAKCACGHPADWHSGMIGCNAEDYDRPACACAEDWAGAVAPTVAAYVAQHRAEAERERGEVQASLDHWQHSAKIEAARLREAKDRADAAERERDAAIQEGRGWWQEAKGLHAEIRDLTRRAEAAERKLARCAALADEWAGHDVAVSTLPGYTYAGGKAHIASSHAAERLRAALRDEGGE